MSNLSNQWTTVANKLNLMEIRYNIKTQRPFNKKGLTLI